MRQLPSSEIIHGDYNPISRGLIAWMNGVHHVHDEKSCQVPMSRGLVEGSGASGTTVQVPRVQRGCYQTYGTGFHRRKRGFMNLGSKELNLEN